jgi:tRNA A-37 threonylcarbamoyl transferase component Bud32
MFSVAHMGLHKIGILHRDISKSTILLGNAGASPGWRGVLIDLSLAFDMELEADSSVHKEPVMVLTDALTSAFCVLTIFTGIASLQIIRHPRLAYRIQ